MTLREEFESEKKDEFEGAELLFELSNQKYIEWLEEIINTVDVPDVHFIENKPPKEGEWYFTTRFNRGIAINYGSSAIDYKGPIDNRYKRLVASTNSAFNVPDLDREVVVTNVRGNYLFKK